MTEHTTPKVRPRKVVRARIERVSTGVPGMDELLGGGIPRGYAVLVLGPPGAGKTTFGLQFLHEGLGRGERCLLLTMEETRESMLTTAGVYGWDFERYTKVEEAAREGLSYDEYLRRKQLFTLVMDPTDLKATVHLLKKDVPAVLRYFGISRVLVDPLSIFELLFTDPGEKRQRLFELTDLIKRSGATAVYTAETRPDNPIATRDYLAEYAVDGFISFRYFEPPRGDLVYAVRVIKMRRVGHSKALVRFDFGKGGLEVYPRQKLDLQDFALTFQVRGAGGR